MKYGIKITHNGTTYTSDIRYKEEEYQKLVNTLKMASMGKVSNLTMYILNQPVFFPKDVLINSIITIYSK